MKRSPRRLLIKLGLLVLAGAIINVAVACSIAFRVPAKPPLSVAVSAEDGKAAVPVQMGPPAKFIEVSGTQTLRTGYSMFTLFAFHRELTSDGAIRYANQFHVYHAGWPCRSMHGWS